MKAFADDKFYVDPSGWTCLNPFPNDIFLGSSKLKKFADDNLKSDENDRKFSKQVENSVGKGEIACYKCFQKTCHAGM